MINPTGKSLHINFANYQRGCYIRTCQSTLENKTPSDQPNNKFLYYIRNISGTRFFQSKHIDIPLMIIEITQIQKPTLTEIDFARIVEYNLKHKKNKQKITKKLSS